MIHTEKKFAYRHKPTGKWCFLDSYLNDGIGWGGRIVELYFVDDFHSEVLYNARNIIEEDLLRSTMNGERYAAKNFSEFELVEIEIQYKIKEQ